MKKMVSLLLIGAFVLIIAGCSAHIHQVGKGAQGNQYIEQRQWYILFGLIPLNEVDTGDMAGGTVDYTITTQTSALDVIMNIFTGYVTVSSRTVTVEK